MRDWTRSVFVVVGSIQGEADKTTMSTQPAARARGTGPSVCTTTTSRDHSVDTCLGRVPNAIYSDRAVHHGTSQCT